MIEITNDSLHEDVDTNKKHSSKKYFEEARKLDEEDVYTQIDDTLTYLYSLFKRIKHPRAKKLRKIISEMSVVGYR